MSKSVETVRTTRVTLRAVPTHRERENPPHLSDLRAFVDLCAGLPDTLQVMIRQGHLDEGGRHDVTFEVVMREPLDA